MANTTATKQRTDGTAPSMTDKVKEAASEVKDRAEETAESVANRVGEVASNVGRRTDGAVSSAGEGMQSFAEKVRERGPQSGVLGSATSAVADTLESTGEYLEEHGLSGMAGDLTDLIRRNPIPALLIGIGVGFLIARATRS